MTVDYWDDVRKIEQFIIHYPWGRYGISTQEAFWGWRRCLEAARQEQLKVLGVESLRSWVSNARENYDTTMKIRLENAKYRFLSEYVKRKLPLEAYHEFQADIEKEGGHQIDKVHKMFNTQRAQTATQGE